MGVSPKAPSQPKTPLFSQLGALGARVASRPPCKKCRLGAPSCTWQVTPAWALPQKHDLCQSTIGNEQVFRDFV